MRFDVSDKLDSFKGFSITDSKTKETVMIHFAWVGKDMHKTGTWDYCPLCEMTEVEHDKFEEFRIKLHQNDNFAKQQLVMNRRHDIWWEKHKTEKTKVRKPRRGREGYTTLFTKFNNYSLKCYDVDGTQFLFSGSLSDKKVYEKYPEWLIESGLWEVINRYHREKEKAGRIWQRFLWKMKINLTSDEWELFRSYEKAGELLKDWLDEDELRWLVHQGELPIQHGEETYLIRKEAYSTVKVVDNKKNIQEYCMVLKGSGGNDIDLLISKILMIKTQPKKFKEIAILRR